MCFGSSNSAGSEIRQQELSRRQAIQEGTANISKAFAGFDPAYYDRVRQNTLGTLLPQEEKQYRSTQKNLAYDVAGRGLLKSSASRGVATDLEQSHSLGQIAVANQAEDAVRQTQQDVERQKQNVTSQLITSQDPAIAAQQAVAAAGSISAPNIVAPLGNLFGGVANAYYANKLGSLYPQSPSLPYGTGQSTSLSGGKNRIMAT